MQWQGRREPCSLHADPKGQKPVSHDCHAGRVSLCESPSGLLPDAVEGTSWGSRVLRERACRRRAPGSGASGAEVTGPGAAGPSWSSGPVRLT